MGRSDAGEETRHVGFAAFGRGLRRDDSPFYKTDPLKDIYWKEGWDKGQRNFQRLCQEENEALREAAAREFARSALTVEERLERIEKHLGIV